MIILYLFKIIYIIFYISFINSYENLKIDINDNINYYNNNKFNSLNNQDLCFILIYIIQEFEEIYKKN